MFLDQVKFSGTDIIFSTQACNDSSSKSSQFSSDVLQKTLPIIFPFSLESLSECARVSKRWCKQTYIFHAQIQQDMLPTRRFGAVVWKTFFNLKNTIREPYVPLDFYKIHNLKLILMPDQIETCENEVIKLNSAGVKRIFTHFIDSYCAPFDLSKRLHEQSYWIPYQLKPISLPNDKGVDRKDKSLPDPTDINKFVTECMQKIQGQSLFNSQASPFLFRDAYSSFGSSPSSNLSCSATSRSNLDSIIEKKRILIRNAMKKYEENYLKAGYWDKNYVLTAVKVSEYLKVTLDNLNKGINVPIPDYYHCTDTCQSLTQIINDRFIEDTCQISI